MRALPPDLALVIPVHNEAALVREVVEDWVRTLDEMGAPYAIHMYDDGSTDGTAAILAELAARHPRLAVSRHGNRGHGPTVLRGYREADAAWVFQADGDGEIPAREILPLWAAREGADLLLGYRTGRRSAPVRRLVSLVARASLGALSGRLLRDVNTPFRLMRGAWLREAAPRLPDDARVPNILLAALAARSGARIVELPVRFEGRPARGSWLSSGRLLRFCAGAILELVRFAAPGGRGR